MAIQIRRGTDANFEANYSNIVDGEPIITTDTERFAVGVSNGVFAEFTNTNVVASEYIASDSNTYVRGDYCTRNGKLYQCIQTTSGAWNSSRWNLVTVMEAVDSENAFKSYGTISSNTTKTITVPDSFRGVIFLFRGSSTMAAYMVTSASTGSTYASPLATGTNITVSTSLNSLTVQNSGSANIYTFYIGNNLLS